MSDRIWTDIPFEWTREKAILFSKWQSKQFTHTNDQDEELVDRFEKEYDEVEIYLEWYEESFIGRTKLSFKEYKQHKNDQQSF